ncbi:hypothetical protein GALMADRAFT_131843 [Galerina marginata CBS 339.88]|uniref:Uncharacterized protein n=1 Tax=Galerina marginata (strain CBS 339.88) TaxID=685588 RepID=A0A067TYN4_GALM3|nr:hypothetical protein GALMADRAFT_131843 [Galerina marginata CBS 339.88]
MATTSSKTNSPSRRLPSSPSPTISPTLARGATARSAASPRLSTLNSAAPRRPVAKSASPTPVVNISANGDIHEALAASLKQETDQKELLLVQIQEKEQLISGYVTENTNLTSALSGAETRLHELYAEQARWEMDLAQRIDISEKLREQVRELEREKRDLQRRYIEQAATFEAERQAFYDNEQHLKSRIQSLTQIRKRTESFTAPVEAEAEEEGMDDDQPSSPRTAIAVDSTTQQDLSDPENEPAEMTSLRLELSTLSTSYASLQSTLILMQTQLVDLKRVNQELQEENESYMILLREKTLSGQFDLMRQVGGAASTDDEDTSDNEGPESTDVSSMRSTGRSTLDRVEEESELLNSEMPGNISDDDGPQPMRGARHHGRPERKRTSSGHGGRGESLADLPITGPGLDLAAELGRAENKDLLAGNSIDDRDRSVPSGKGKKGKKNPDGTRISQSESNGMDSTASNADLDALRTEVKSLKDANKALSLYASKIIDRIIAQEGFEHVLAVDYDKEKDPQTPSTAVPYPNASKSLSFSQPKTRPQSVMVGRSSSNPTVEAKQTTPNLSRPDPKAKRRSLSFDWTSFSLFNSDKKPEPSPNLRPLTLKPGASPVTGARKLDTFEDEEDRKERERLHATMKLMGIQPRPRSPSPLNSPVPPPVERASSAPSIPTPKSNRRFSLFGSKTIAESSDASSTHSASSSLNQFNRSPLGLTEEALEHAEAENSLAALDARERDLSAEIAKGSGGGFTEIGPRTSRRGRKSAGGSSGSTVWSAGMSGNGDD